MNIRAHAIAHASVWFKGIGRPGHETVTDAIETAMLSARAAAFEEAAKIAEGFPLSPQKMEDALRWCRTGGFANAVAGSANAIAAAIRQHAKGEGK